MPGKDALAQYIRDAMIVANCQTQAELARRAGLSRPTISLMLTGKRFPDVESCYKLARALDCNVATLLRLAGHEAVAQPDQMDWLHQMRLAHAIRYDLRDLMADGLLPPPLQDAWDIARALWTAAGTALGWQNARERQVQGQYRDWLFWEVWYDVPDDSRPGTLSLDVHFALGESATDLVPLPTICVYFGDGYGVESVELPPALLINVCALEAALTEALVAAYTAYIMHPNMGPSWSRELNKAWFRRENGE